jgi:hypothetical protein
MRRLLLTHDAKDCHPELVEGSLTISGRLDRCYALAYEYGTAFFPVKKEKLWRIWKLIPY